MIIDPNVDKASYEFTLADGKKVRVEVHKKLDGTTDIKVIGQDR